MRRGAERLEPSWERRLQGWAAMVARRVSAAGCDKRIIRSNTFHASQPMARPCFAAASLLEELRVLTDTFDGRDYDAAEQRD